MTIHVVHDGLEDVSIVEIVVAGWTFFRYFHPEPFRDSREDRAEACAADVAAQQGVEITRYTSPVVGRI